MRRTPVSACVVLLPLLTALPALAQQTAIPARPELSVLLEPRAVRMHGAYVQAQVRLRMQVVSPHPFTALHLDLPPIENARVLTLIKPRTREIQVYGHTGYAYETRLALFPEQSGELHIPPITVSGEVTPEGGQARSFSEHWGGIRVPVHPVDPSYESRWWMVADQVEMEESWTPSLDQVRVGDLLQRHLRLTVHGIRAEQLPAFEQGRNAGYAVIGSSADSRTEVTPDGLVAHLRQTWDLQIRSAQVLYVSPLRADYWDPAARKPASASLPGTRIEPLPRDLEAIRANLIKEAMDAHQRKRISAHAVLWLTLLGLVILVAAVVAKMLPTRADLRLRRKCENANSPVDCLAAAMAWSAETYGCSGGAVVRQLRTRFGAGETEALERLQAVVFSRAASPCRPGIWRHL